MSAGELTATTSYDLSASGLVFDMTHNPQALVFFHGLTMDPNGTNYSVKMAATVDSPTTCKVQVTTLQNSVTTNVVYGLLLFDPVLLTAMPYAYYDSGVNTATNNGVAALDVTTPVFITASFIVGMSSYTMTAGSDIKFSYSNASASFASTGSFDLLAMAFWNFRQKPACAAGYEYVSATTDVCTEICGDGLVFTLPCDDGNLVDGDGCSATCQVETGYACTNTPAPSVCVYVLPVDVTLELVLTEK